MTYGPMSTSYLTTSSDSIGLTSVTALTEVSTTGERYLTAESTTGTIYETSLQAAQQYLSQRHSQTGNGTSYYLLNTYITSVTNPSCTIQNNGQYSYITASLVGYGTFFSTQNNAGNIQSGSRTTYFEQYQGTLTFRGYPNDPPVYAGVTYFKFAGNTSSWTAYNRDLRDDTYSYYYSRTYKNIPATTITTNTIYETIEVTTATSYLTGSVTTGYSGIYSSIQSTSSSWYTSATNSEGMYDTTALTRESTSGTSYLTISAPVKNFNISYYEGAWYTFITNNRYHTVSITVYGNATTSSSNPNGTYLYYFGSFTYKTSRDDTGTKSLTSSYFTINSTTTGNTAAYYVQSLAYLYNRYGAYTFYTTSREYSTADFNYGATTSMTAGLTLSSITAITTGTSYITCESTSGYSGVSSSSTINSGWS